ncbi:MAG: GIY-YIG nuclease family protein [Bacteroidia bacterium]
MKSKKELKQEYKQKKPEMGIFQIKNLSSGKTLIEDATDIPARWNRYRTELKFGSCRNKALQKDWNELGEDNFEFFVLSTLELKEEDHANVRIELKSLKEMVLEEISLAEELRY